MGRWYRVTGGNGSTGVALAPIVLVWGVVVVPRRAGYLANDVHASVDASGRVCEVWWRQLEGWQEGEGRDFSSPSCCFRHVHVHVHHIEYLTNHVYASVDAPARVCEV